MLRVAEILLPCVDPDRTAEFYATTTGGERDGRRVRLGDVTLVCEATHRLSLAFAGDESKESCIDPDGRTVRFGAEGGGHGVPFNPEDRPEDVGIG